MMDGIWTTKPRTLDTTALTQGSLSIGDTTSAAFDEALTGSAAGLVFNLGFDTAARIAEDKLPYEEAERRVKRQGVDIKIPESGYTPSQLDRIIERKKDENARRYALSLSQGGAGATTAEFAAGLAGAMVDPLNVATAFIPFVGQAKYAQMLKAAASPMGRAGVRAGVGAVEGFAGTMVLEPGVYAARRYFQDEYTVADSLMNVLFGTVMGAGMHTAGGTIADVYRSRKGIEQPWATKDVGKAIADAETRLNMETHDVAIRHAMAADIEGRVADPATVVKAMEDPAVKVGAGDTAITFREAQVDRSDGTKVDGLYAEFDNNNGGTGSITIAVEEGRMYPTYVENGLWRPGETSGGAVVKAYMDAIAEATRRGLVFTSDNSVTKSAARVWDSLIRRGYEVEKNPEAKLDSEASPPRWITEDGSPVFTVKGSPENVGTGGRAPKADLSSVRSTAEKSAQIPKGADPAAAMEADAIIKERQNKSIDDLVNEDMADLTRQAKMLEQQLGIEGVLDSAMREVDAASVEVKSMIDAVEVAAICRIRT